MSSLLGRNSNPSNLKKIVESINKMNFGEINRLDTSYKQWGFLKNCILNVINKIAPIKKLTKVDKNCIDHWWNSELFLIKRQRDFLFTIATSSKVKKKTNLFNSFFTSINSESLANVGLGLGTLTPMKVIDSSITISKL